MQSEQFLAAPLQHFLPLSAASPHWLTSRPRPCAFARHPTPQAHAFVGSKLSAALGAGASAPWQDVELAVSLLYQLGEGAPDEAMKAGEPPLFL